MRRGDGGWRALRPDLRAGVFVATWHETATVCGADDGSSSCMRQAILCAAHSSGVVAGGGPAMRMCVSLIWHQAWFMRCRS